MKDVRGVGSKSMCRLSSRGTCTFTLPLAEVKLTCFIPFFFFFCIVAFRIYDMDNDGFISNGELFQVLKMMVGNNLKETQLQQIVDKTVINADKDGDGKISFSEFCAVSEQISYCMCVDHCCCH